MKQLLINLLHGFIMIFLLPVTGAFILARLTIEVFEAAMNKSLDKCNQIIEKAGNLK